MSSSFPLEHFLREDRYESLGYLACIENAPPDPAGWSVVTGRVSNLDSTWVSKLGGRRDDRYGALRKRCWWLGADARRPIIQKLEACTQAKKASVEVQSWGESLDAKQ
jgi:hypothetical protein